MLFAKKEKTANDKMARVRGIVSFMVKPNIGATVQPLRETTSVFIQLLALVFAGQGMFPRNHPALTGAPGAYRLTLMQVLSTAWQSLTFTVEGIPRILLFAAVIASMIFSTLAIAVFAISLFIGKAHAQTAGCGGGYFQPCDPTQDIALSWINYIFNAQPMYNYLNTVGQVIPQFSSVQTALISALGFYSDAILIVAAIILFYHLTAMVVETAHHGQAMGKRASQIWAPIRLVVAIGLLVPIAGGLNSGQYIVITIAEWGSNLADQVWSVFLNGLTSETMNGVAPAAPYARKAVYDTVLMQACMQAYNSYYGVNNNGGGNNNASGPPPACTSNPSLAECAGVSVQQATLSGGATMNYYDVTGAPVKADSGICGHYIFPAATTGNDAIAQAMGTNISQISTQAYQQMQTEVQNYVQQHLTSFIPPNLGGTNDQPIPQNTADFENLVSDYVTALQNALSNAASSNAQSMMASIASTSEGQGWVSAGAWFNTVARLQSEMMDTQGMVPTTEPPNMSALQTTNTFSKFVFPVVQNFENWLGTETPQGGAQTGTGAQQQMLQAAAGLSQQQGKRPTQLMDRIFAFIDWVASWNGVWHSYGGCGTALTSQNINCVTNSANNANSASASNFTLGVMFLSSNPLAEIAALGHANIQTAYDLFDKYLEFIAVGGTTTMTGEAIGGALSGILGLAGKGAGALVNSIGSVISMFCIIFFTTGVMLAYFLPLIPFFRFMFNVLTWIVSLLEAVIAVPLIALAHLNPVGEGLPGDSAKRAYYFIFNIFLRPTLMVFGLIVGLLIFFIAASYMNLLYIQAVTGTGGLATGHLFLSRFIYSFLYVFILYMAANSAFHMIDWLPQHAVKWMGGEALHWQQMGDPSQIQQPMALVTGYADSQLMGAVRGVGGPGAFAMREGLMGRGSKQWSGDFHELTGKVAGQFENLSPGSGQYVKDAAIPAQKLVDGAAAAAQGMSGNTQPDASTTGPRNIPGLSPAAEEKPPTTKGPNGYP